MGIPDNGSFRFIYLKLGCPHQSPERMPLMFMGVHVPLKEHAFQDRCL